MSICKMPSGNETAVHLEAVPERFQDDAWQVLEKCPMHIWGECFNPDCSRPFNPTRSWQKYCCKACVRAGEAEFRTWGARLAMPALAWITSKYAVPGSPEHDRTKAARRKITEIQRAWLNSRQARVKRAKKELSK